MKRGGFDFQSVAPLYNDLIQRGFSPIHAAGIAGNFAYESGPKGRIDYGVQELRPTAGRGGYGAAQWTGPRRVALEQFAKREGLPLNERETQMKYFDRERSGSEKAAFDRLQKAGDVNSATKSFMQNYERPRASTANLAARQQLAQEIYTRGQRGDYNTPDAQTQLAKNETPLPPSRPSDLQTAQTQIARNDAPPPGSVLNRINPKDPSGPLLPETAKGYFEQRYAQNEAQNPMMSAPQQGAPANIGQQPMLARNDVPLPPSRPSDLQLTQSSPTQGAPGMSEPVPVQMSDVPLPPSRPSSFGPASSPIQMAQVHASQPTGGMNNMLAEPQGGVGGVEGFAAGVSSPAQMSPEMMNPQAMAGDAGGFGDLGGLFADAFMPAEMPTQFADAGSNFGSDFGSMGFGDFGGGLGGLFG